MYRYNGWTKHKEAGLLLILVIASCTASASRATEKPNFGYDKSPSDSVSIIPTITDPHSKSTSESTSTTTTTTSLPRLGGHRKIDISWIFEGLDAEDGIFGINRNKSADFAGILKKVHGFARNTVDEVLRAALPHVLRIVIGLDLSLECMAGGLQLIGGIRNLEGWALRMLDSTGFYPGGLLQGSVASLGDYDMCLAVKAFGREDEDDPDFVGQYCPVIIGLILPPKQKPYRPHLLFREEVRKELEKIIESSTLLHMGYAYLSGYRTGVCVPSSCTREDIQSIATAIASITSVLNITVLRCETKYDFQPIDGPIIFCIVVVAIVCSIVFVATLVDSFFRTDLASPGTKPRSSREVNKSQVIIPGLLIDVCRCLSLATNARKLFGLSSYDSSSKTKHLRFLHGVRFLSMAWIILGHTYYYVNYQQMHGLVHAVDIGANVWFQLVLNVTLAVDTFFVISGFLVIYIGFQKMDECGGRFSYVAFYIHRIWRLSPLYLMTIAIMIILPILGSGPMWKEQMDEIAGKCRANWWANALYVNNFVKPTTDVCLGASWYIALLFQYFLITPPILITLYKRPRIGVASLAFLTATCMALSAMLTVIWSLPSTGIFPLLDHEERESYLLYMYRMPYCHGGPYFIGMTTGYILYKNPNMNIKPFTKWLGWLLCSALALGVIYSVYPWNRGDNVPDSLGAVFNAFNRTLWAASLSWIFIACATGNAGMVNSFLSANPFILLGRLTYATYLVHPLVIYVQMSYSRNVHYYVHLNHVFHFSAYLCISHVLAAVFTLFFESPFISLEELIFSKLSIKQRSSARMTKDNAVSTTPTPMTRTEAESDLRRGTKLTDCGGCCPAMSKMIKKWEASPPFVEESSKIDNLVMKSGIHKNPEILDGPRYGDSRMANDIPRCMTKL